MTPAFNNACSTMRAIARLVEEIDALIKLPHQTIITLMAKESILHLISHFNIQYLPT